MHLVSFNTKKENKVFHFKPERDLKAKKGCLFKMDYVILIFSQSENIKEGTTSLGLSRILAHHHTNLLIIRKS